MDACPGLWSEVLGLLPASASWNRDLICERSHGRKITFFRSTSASGKNTTLPNMDIIFVSSLWFLHTARKRERDRDQDRDREWEEWVTIYYAVLFTLQRNQEREWENGQWVLDPFFCT